jgi:hypothetical protein
VEYRPGLRFSGVVVVAWTLASHRYGVTKNWYPPGADTSCAKASRVAGPITPRVTARDASADLAKLKAGRGLLGFVPVNRMDQYMKSPH